MLIPESRSHVVGLPPASSGTRRADSCSRQRRRRRLCWSSCWVRLVLNGIHDKLVEVVDGAADVAGVVA